jgi:hypothetical protein
MIDWFVLLTPLALLPIFLLLVFIGCVLDRSGTGSQVFFSYPSGLTNDGLVTSITVSLEFGGDFDCEEEDEGSTFGPSPPSPTTIATVNPNGDTISLGLISLSCSGGIRCCCTFMGTAGSQNPCSGFKNKDEDESAPSFTLNRDNSVLTIT